MDINKEALVKWGAYRLPSSDIDQIFKYSGLAGNALSPYRYNAEQAAVSNPSQWFKALAETTVFSKIAGLLLEPDLKIMFHSGGSIAEDEEYYVFLSTENEMVLAQFNNPQGDLLMLLFPDWDSCLQWWATIYSTEGSGDHIQVFPGTMEIETLVCALNCVDFYRRAYMESMLDFRSQVDISMHTHDFVQLLKDSLASADTRWLLPSLFVLTPGLKNYSIALLPAHLKKIEALRFISCNEELLLTLDERSQTMATEFLMTWMGAVGLQASALINDEERPLSHIFLASTVCSNHLFSFETGTEGELRCQYQAIQRYELIRILSNWVNALRKAVGYVSPAATKDVPQDNICGKCGAHSRAGQEFCTSCGALILEERGGNANE